MEIISLFDRLTNKLHWLYTRQWPILFSQLQFCGLLFNCRPMTVSQKSALIISPHQDDETLGCGGVIALKRAQGIPVQVVFMTDGAASHIWHPQFQNGEIAPIRKQEALAALAILGVAADQVHFFDDQDGQLKWLEASEQQDLVAQLSQLMQTAAPGEIYVTHRHDVSNDHEMTFKLVQAAIAASGLTVDVFEYAIWRLWKPQLLRDRPQLSRGRRLPIHAAQLQKQQAIKAYRSQYLPIADTNSKVLPDGFLWRFTLPYEVFFSTSKDCL
jgi:N-acetylglucosamine malate deacetylase 1